MPRPQPYTIYRGVPIFLYQEVGGKPHAWGALIQFQQQLIAVEKGKGKRPTLAHMLTAARRLIDLLEQDEANSCAGPDPSLKCL